MSLKNIALFVSTIPTIVVLIILSISPRLLNGGKEIDAAFIMSLVGIALSYYGLIFSLYAALQVQKLADSYFFKSRSPDLQRKLSAIVKAVGDFSREPSVELRAQKFISESSVALRLAIRIKNKHVTEIAKQAESALDSLKSSMKISYAEDTLAGNVPNYWEFHQKITELLDELSEQLKDARALS